jgi:hypothetical protein
MERFYTHCQLQIVIDHMSRALLTHTMQFTFVHLSFDS